MRELPRGEDDLPERVDVGSWRAGPSVTVVTMDNVNLTMRDGTEHEGVTALVLHGPVFPIKEDFKELGYEFVHGKVGINQWVRVVGGKENAASLVKASAEVLAEHGWECETAEADRPQTGTAMTNEPEVASCAHVRVGK